MSSDYTINDIIMLMFYIRDNETINNNQINFLKSSFENEHSIQSIELKLKDVCSSLKYLIDNNLIKLDIKYKKYNKNKGKYKKYNYGNIKESIDIFLNLIHQKNIDEINDNIRYNYIRNCIENKNSVEYKENYSFNNNYINEKLKKTKIFNPNKFINIQINEDILDKLYNTLNPNLRNIINTFFNVKTNCKICKNKNIERCHNKSRKGMFLDTIHNNNLINNNVNIGDLLRLFIMEHKKEPLWFLCKTCHHYWDKKHLSN
jgi:hypothetical protein